VKRRALDRLLVIGPALIVLVAGWRWRWTCDDAFIDFRVVRNLLDGAGPVFNPGERVEAFTSPLWVALLTVAVTPWRLARAQLPLEWASVVLGLAGSVAGVAAAGAARLGLARGARVVPVAGWLLAVLPATWGFATSGLETGLVLAWLGLAFYAASTGRRSAAWLAGLGPLVRPDLAVVALGLGAMVLARARSRARVVVEAAALPLGYQLARMGYFAATVPNTALAKEGFLPYWSQGARYLADFVLPYWLWIPLALVLTIAIHRRRNWRDERPAYFVALAGVAHAIAVVRWGGDFMHARMLLPSLFAILLPMGVSLDDAHERWLLAPLAAWAVACAIFFRAPMGGRIGRDQIADERLYYVVDAGVPNPILVHDFVPRTRSALPGDREAYARISRCLADVARDRRVLVLRPYDAQLTLACRDLMELPLADARHAQVVAIDNIGIVGYLAAPDVQVVDLFGLADPITSRMRLRARGRPGHEKHQPGVRAWTVARFADPAAPLPAGLSPEGVAAARAALQCGALRELDGALHEPLTWRRFLRNVALAPSLTRVRFSNVPDEARRELCD
jgi:arabinofuranosyltransferase